MGDVLSKLFVDVTTLPNDWYGFIQLIYIGAGYGVVLMIGSNLIKDGSELLLLVPRYAGVVGSIILPVLGAIPDGAIVLFSGLGPNAQEEVSVGVGALAGSTVMLLTVPWFMSVLAGRVNLDSRGEGNYVKPKNAAGSDSWAKLQPANKIAGTGVTLGSSIQHTAKVMVVTLIPLFIIQVPAVFGDCTRLITERRCRRSPASAVIGCVAAVALFAYYLWDQARLADDDEVKQDRIDQLRASAIHQRLMSLRGLFPETLFDSKGAVHADANDKRFRALLKPFFRHFDVDNSGSIDKNEFAALLREMGEIPRKEELDELMAFCDRDGNGTIEFDEFVVAMVDLLHRTNKVSIMSSGEKLRASASPKDKKKTAKKEDKEPSGSAKRKLAKGGKGGKDADSFEVAAKKEEEFSKGSNHEDEDDEGEDEPEMPDDLAHLSPDEQQSRLLRRSAWQMTAGVALVLLFSDPMVAVLSDVGRRTNIAPFYIAFCLAPLASNAAEFVAAYAYALKKTEKTITISISSLLGAACMNNTFCLAIFLALVYVKKLKWEFAAETAAIVAVELVMFVIASRRSQSMLSAFFVLSLLPLALGLVMLLESYGYN